MRATDSAESPQPSSQPSPHGASDEARNDTEDALRVSSLRPVPCAFSQRRLLNIASIVVAAVALAVLALHWLPGVLPKPLTAAELERIHARQTMSALAPRGRSSGWKPSGPDWAQDIAFTSNGALGYVCGIDPLNPLVLFGVYDVHQQTWTTLPTPASGGSRRSCQVFVSPMADNDVVLAVEYCTTLGTCADEYPASQLYASYDSGETWQRLPLPGLVTVSSVAWANGQLYLAVRGNLARGSSTNPINETTHLLVRRSDHSFTEISARQLIGQDMQIESITLLSSGTMLYASVDGMTCPSQCPIQVRSGDNGAHWSPLAATYRGNRILVSAAPPDSNTLIGWAFLPQSGVTVVLRSDDNGAHWHELPTLPRNPESASVSAFVAPDNTIYAWSDGASDIYVLGKGATRWEIVAPMPDGDPTTVQVNATGHAVALWGQAQNAPTNPNTADLEYYPLTMA